MKKLLLFIPLLLSFNAFGSFFPEGIVAEEADLLKTKQVPERYLEIIEELKREFDRDLSEAQASLEVRFDMDSDVVNAYADREGDKWLITFNGAMIRHRHFDENIFTMVLCHELGHHLGGAPLKLPGDSERGWISAEGQADYYTTNICAKRLFENKDNADFMRGQRIHKRARKGCGKYNGERRDLCLRSALLSERTGQFLHRIGYTRRGPRGRFPRVQTPDRSVTTYTNLKHPEPQCRLDTFFQGALCPKLYGSPYAQDPNCYGEKEFSGARPGCWFAVPN